MVSKVERCHPVLRPAGFSDGGGKFRTVRPFARLEFANFQGQYSLFLFCRQWIARKENPACAGLLRSVFFMVAAVGIDRK